MQKAKMLFVGITLESLFLSSCYNEVNEHPEDEDIPIRVATDILPPTTRVTNNQFEAKDAIGFFLLTNTDNLKEAHFNNIPFTFQKGKDFTPSKEIFYPKTKNSCEIISYYPFRKDVLTDDGLLKIATENSTGIPDFMIARKEKVFANLKPQQLNFKHVLAKVEIEIKPTKGYTPEEILSTSPLLEIHNLPHEALLDIRTFIFSHHGKNLNIQPKTAWRVQDGGLKGFSFLYIPQEKTQTNQFITIQAENITYKCPFPENWDLKSGTINRLTINYTPSKGIEIAKAESDIQEWIEGQNASSDSQIETNAIQNSMFNFEKTSVYNLVNDQGIIRAEICRELLVSKELKTEAIVIYPIDDNNQVSNKGVCLKTFDSTAHIAGETITWNKAKNSFSLSGDKGDAINTYFFIDSKGAVCFTKPEDCELIHIEESYLKRNANYPIVKIGTQYWTGTNWQEKQKTDHTPLAFEANKIVINAGYTTNKDTPTECFYNRAAIESELIAPEDWSISTLEDWKTLFAYIQNDYNLLKSGKWDNGASEPINTRLAINQIGSFAKGEFRSNSTCYWTYNSTAKDKLTAVIFHNLPTYAPLEIRTIQSNDYLLSIRLIKR